ncbi:MAG: SET domain-containing protein-lysine N-methyltransferase [Pyrinomonadaceae bacterium]|nr:SET domain-containing protein-lysine N-methyltransferase [Pyrinomonadaceae bacterium]MDQ3133390.1 SET domain-containing protein-lysine N-methyltransferase [Acidobacteriota bacterium]
MKPKKIERVSPASVAPGIRVGKSGIDGQGCFATVPYRRGRKIVELTGELISRGEAARRMRGRRRLHICAINSYWGIDSSVGGNGSQFINHSCRPNSFVRIMHSHIIFFALRDIEPGEEITLDYVESYHDDDYRCRCKAEDCRGTINVKAKGRRQR